MHGNFANDESDVKQRTMFSEIDKPPQKTRKKSVYMIPNLRCI